MSEAIRLRSSNLVRGEQDVFSVSDEAAEAVPAESVRLERNEKGVRGFSMYFEFRVKMESFHT